MKIIDKKSVLLDFEEYKKLQNQVKAYEYLKDVYEQVENELLAKIAEERGKSKNKTISFSDIEKKYGI